MERTRAPRRAAAPPADRRLRRSRPERRRGAEERETAPFSSLLVRVDAGPAPRPTPPIAPGSPCDPSRVQVLQAASSRDGVHVATLKVEGEGGPDVGLSVVLRGNALTVRIEAPDAHGAAWLHERSHAIEQAVERAGLDLSSLDIGHGGTGGGGGRGREDGTRERPPRPGPSLRRGEGWTL